MNTHRNGYFIGENPIDNQCNYYEIDDFISKLKNKSNEAFNQNTLSLLHLNARSLSKNFDSLQTLLCTLNFPFSIIGISETWLNKNSPPVFNIPNYDMIRADRKAGRGGGV